MVKAGRDGSGRCCQSGHQGLPASEAMGRLALLLAVAEKYNGMLPPNERVDQRRVVAFNLTVSGRLILFPRFFPWGLPPTNADWFPRLLFLSQAGRLELENSSLPS